MNEYRGSMVLGGTKLELTGTATRTTPAKLYRSMQAALAAIAAGHADLIDLSDASAADRPIRVDLSMTIRGSGSEAVDEDVYLLTPLTDEEGKGVAVERAATLAWVRGSDLGPQPGGQQEDASTYAWPASVTITNTGLLLARTRVEIAGHNQSPCIPTIYDIGNASGVLRVFNGNAGAAPTGYQSLTRLWR